MQIRSSFTQLITYILYFLIHILAAFFVFSQKNQLMSMAMMIQEVGYAEGQEKLLKDVENKGEEKQELEEESLKDGKKDHEDHHPVDDDNDDEQSSPRGVLEIDPLSPASDHSNTGSVEGDSNDSLESEKTSEVIDDNQQLWKSLFDQIKKRSPKKLPSIPFLGGPHEFSKSLKRLRFGRNHSADETLDCGDFVVPKPSWKNFTYRQLVDATDNFSTDNLLGKGGSAAVYKGRLPDGQIVAVKRILKMEKNKEDRVAEFLSELGIIAHVNHPNAAKLIGFSIDNGLHLVLQFLPHGSLATLIHGSPEGAEWSTRYKVALGVAEGLKYLHCDCPRRIIHRDITASNILLAEDYEPQISDFGLAKWLPEKWVNHQVSPIEGTFGYMAPEYFMHGIVHEKTDVFAFGVLLLELITGRHAVDSCSQNLAMWAKPLLEENNEKELVDPRLGGKYDVLEMRRAMFTASACLHHLPNMRPNMKKVVQLLKGEYEPVEMKMKSMGGGALVVEACDLEDYTSTTYLNDLNRHMQLVME